MASGCNPISLRVSLGDDVISRINNNTSDLFVSTDCLGKAVSCDNVTRVFYHGANCPDGFASAYVAFLKYGNSIHYESMEHHSVKTTPNVRGQSVVVIDYCFSKSMTLEMIEQTNGKFLVLDHHASAEHDLLDIPLKNKVFNMKQSGATLAWNFFFPFDPVPLWLRYVEDKDIWRWKLNQSEEFAAGFSMIQQTFDSYHSIHTGGIEAVDKIINEGASILKYRKSVIESHVKRAIVVKLKCEPNLTCAIVNSSTLASEIGNAICVSRSVDIAVIWFYDHNKRAHSVSLRSVDGEKADVSLIAKQYGGGGHRCASGFSYKGASIEDLLLL